VARPVSCAGAHDGALYVCGHHSGFGPIKAGVALSMDGGQTFQRYMAFTEVMAQVSCESVSSTALACSGCKVARAGAVRFAELLVCSFAWLALIDRRRRRMGRRP
jgi:hypothetical protein